MDRMLVVVFDSESKAYEGKKALLQLDGEGSISAYGYAVVAKNSDGTTTVKQGDDTGPLGTLAGTAVGSLIGVLGGPAGLAIGAAVGLTAGATVDLHNARISDDFIDDVTKVLLPNRVAVIAEIEEDWTTPVDTRMEARGHRRRRGRCGHQGRHSANESGARPGSHRPQSKAAGKDQPAQR